MSSRTMPRAASTSPIERLSRPLKLPSITIAPPCGLHEGPIGHASGPFVDGGHLVARDEQRVVGPEL